MKTKKLNWNALQPRLLILPSMIIVLGVIIFPVIYSVITSFCKYNMNTRSLSFVGLQNYAALFKDRYFINSMKLTIIFTIVTVAAEIVIGIGVALILNQEFFGRGFVRGLMILPWALPSVVNAVMWKWIFDGSYGVLNAILMKFGMISKPIIWLGTTKTAFGCMMVVNIWKETPYVILLTIAALANIPEDLYEAAKVDGANAWRRFWSVTLPMIKSVVAILTITKTIWALQTYDLVKIFTGGGPASSTELMSFYIHKNTFKFLDFGYGSAMSYTLAICCFILTLIYIHMFVGEGGSKKKKRSA